MRMSRWSRGLVIINFNRWSTRVVIAELFGNGKALFGGRVTWF